MVKEHSPFLVNICLLADWLGFLTGFEILERFSAQYSSINLRRYNFLSFPWVI